MVEVLVALSLTTDLASGVPFEKGLRTCAVADAFAAELGLDPELRRAVFQASLLRAIGCTAHAPENSAMFGDDTAFLAALKVMDPGDEQVFTEQLRRFGRWAGVDQAPVLVQRFVEAAPIVGPYAARSGCEVSRALGPGLGLSAAALDALEDVYERWDGLGIPEGRCGDQLTLTGRVVHIAEQAVLAYAERGVEGAVSEVRRRRGGHLDPALVDVFVARGGPLLAPMTEPDALNAVLTREPLPVAYLPHDDLARLCQPLAVVADLKSTYLRGHSVRVADLAGAAANLAGLSDPEAMLARTAALVHNIGCVVVPSRILDGEGPLGAADVERLSLDAYWTHRILERSPALAPLASLAARAAAYHGQQSIEPTQHQPGSPAAHLLEAAELFSMLTEEQPRRRPVSFGAAAGLLRDWVSAGRLDGAAASTVIEAAGLPRPRRLLRPPSDTLTRRELEVLRLTARGLSNRAIAAELVISERTVGHHLTHIYDKTGRRTRAGVAVFAVEHRLLRSRTTSTPAR